MRETVPGEGRVTLELNYENSIHSLIVFVYLRKRPTRDPSGYECLDGTAAVRWRLCSETSLDILEKHLKMEH